MRTRITRLILPTCLLAAAPAAAQNVVTVVASNDAIQAPDTIPAGWTTVRLVNRDAHMHVAQFARVDGGHSVEDFARVYHEAWRTDGPRPVWGVRVGGAGADGGTARETTVHLQPGTYALYCFMDGGTGVPHVFGRQMVRQVTVVPRPDSAAPPPPPEPTVTLTMTDYAFGLSRALTAGRHVVRVVNRGQEPHEASVVRLPDGMTAEDLQRVLADYLAMLAALKPGADPAPVELPPIETIGGVAGLAGGLEAYFEVELTPGPYVLVCFVTAPDGRPHVAHGMVQYSRVPPE